MRKLRTKVSYRSRPEPRSPTPSRPPSITTHSLSILSSITERFETRKRTSCPPPRTNESPAASTTKASLTSSARSVRKSSLGSPSFVSCPAISSTSITQSASGLGSKSRMRAHSASKPFPSIQTNCKAFLLMKSKAEETTHRDRTTTVVVGFLALLYEMAK